MNSDNYDALRLMDGYSLKECAKRLSVSVALLRKEQRLGRLRVTKFGDRAIVLGEDWKSYIAANRALTSRRSVRGFVAGDQRYCDEHRKVRFHNAKAIRKQIRMEGSDND